MLIAKIVIEANEGMRPQCECLAEDMGFLFQLIDWNISERDWVAIANGDVIPEKDGDGEVPNLPTGVILLPGVGPRRRYSFVVKEWSVE